MQYCSANSLTSGTDANSPIPVESSLDRLVSETSERFSEVSPKSIYAVPGGCRKTGQPRKNASTARHRPDARPVGVRADLKSVPRSLVGTASMGEIGEMPYSQPESSSEGPRGWAPLDSARTTPAGLVAAGDLRHPLRADADRAAGLQRAFPLDLERYQLDRRDDRHRNTQRQALPDHPSVFLTSLRTNPKALARLVSNHWSIMSWNLVRDT